MRFWRSGFDRIVHHGQSPLTDLCRAGEIHACIAGNQVIVESWRCCGEEEEVVESEKLWECRIYGDERWFPGQGDSYKDGAARGTRLMAFSN